MRPLARSLSAWLVVSVAFGCDAFGRSEDAPSAPPADAAPAADDGGARDGGDPVVPPGTVVPLSEKPEQVPALATDGTRIYWWSVPDQAVVYVEKSSPAVRQRLVARPGQNVTEMVADVSGVYWLENGPGDGGATTYRVEHLAPGQTQPTSLATRTAALYHLTLAGTRLGFLEPGSPGSVDVAFKTGQFFACGLSLSRDALATNGADLYYFYLGNVFRLTSDPGTGCAGGGKIMDNLSGPRALVGDGTRLYAVVAFGQAQSALVKFRNDGAPTDTPEQLALLENGTTMLALDDIGIVVANATTRTILRVDRNVGQAPKSLQSEVHDLNAIAADTNGVYWATEQGAFWLTR